MILGTGFDLIDLEDFARTVERSGEKYIERIYTAQEIEYCRAQPHPSQSFAARFAAKEAAMKALGIAGEDALTWHDFEVVLESSGRPCMSLHGHAAAKSSALNLTHIHVSLSHSRSSAGALVIAEGSGQARTLTARAENRHGLSEGEIAKHLEGDL
ncbi:MAG: holo-ACP synthase [Bryobacteraceae bacterium]|nr:holo-ACP synthase [Bryobacteraceae bacterium]